MSIGTTGNVLGAVAIDRLSAAVVVIVVENRVARKR